MHTRRLNSYETAVVQKHLANESAAFVKTRGRTTNLVYSPSQVNRAMMAERAEREAKEQAQMAADAEYFKSAEFKKDVIDAIIESGATLQQAEGRTRDQVRLYQEARNFNLI